MRVVGDKNPEVIKVEQMLNNNLAEVRIRQNVSQITVTNEFIGTHTMYQYDEYVMKMPYRDTLKAEIESNLQDWLATGRTLEYNVMASIPYDMKQALDILGITDEPIE